MEKLVPKIRFPEFEENWKIKNLKSELLLSRLGGNYSNSENINNYPLIKMGNIDRGKIKLDKIDYILENEIINSEDEIQLGDLFFNTRNTLELVGKVAIWRGELKRAYYNSNLMLLKFNNNYFMNYSFNSPKMINKLRNIATGTTSVAAIYSKDLFKLKLKLPSIAEQQKIATFLTSVDERITLLEKQKQGLESYKKGVMQQLFSQQMRFKDDAGNDFPDWEEKKLGEEVLITKGQQLNKETLSLEGNYPCQNGGIEPSGYTDNFNAYENTITISEGGNSCGYVNYMSTKFWCGGHCYTLTDVKLENKFLYQYLKYHQEQIMNLRVGSGLPNIQKSTLSSFKIHKPCLEEQKKIASFLFEIDMRIEVVSKQIEQSKVFKKGLLQQMFV